MKKAPSKNIEEYCLTAWNSMKANLYRWGKPETDIRSMTRIWYVNVHDSGKDKLNLISEAAIPYAKKSQTKKITWDHYTRPQAQSYMIYDNPEKYLFEYETFRKLFYDARKAVIVTCDENDRASKDSFNDGVNYTMKHKSNELYNSLGIKMYEFSDEYHWKNRSYTPVSLDKMIFNQDALLNEERFIK